jgi:hypothetical protein
MKFEGLSVHRKCGRQPSGTGARLDVIAPKVDALEWCALRAEMDTSRQVADLIVAMIEWGVTRAVLQAAASVLGRDIGYS